MPFQNSWLAHLCAVNKNDLANKNFDAVANTMEAKNAKNDKKLSLTEDPDSIVVVAVNRQWVKLIHSLKNLWAPAPTKPLQWEASWATELEPYQLQSTCTLPHTPSRSKSLQLIKYGDARTLKC